MRKCVETLNEKKSCRYWKRLVERHHRMSVVIMARAASSAPWALSDRAAARGWILGYPDGTFRPDNYITRAEAVTLVDRASGRIPDTDYIRTNISDLKRFSDVRDTHWAYGSVMEAANAHDYIQAGDEENWTGLK